MEQAEFDSLISTPDDLVKKIQAVKNDENIVTYQDQYNPKKHEVMDTGKRLDKSVTTDTGNTLVPVARLPIPLQKKIVALAAAFLCGNPIKLSCLPVDQKQKDMLAVLQRTWDDNKLDYDSKKLAKLMMSETEVAELWYAEPIEQSYWSGTVNDIPKVNKRLRMKVLANKYNDKLYPVCNNSGDMIAFARGYALKIDGKDEQHFDIYTDKTLYKGIKNDSGWNFIIETNFLLKIPVIYYHQEAPEWSDVQEMIDRLEKLISNHADTNDYFVSPMVVVAGTVEGFSKKGESGKVLELKNGATADYLSWDQSPESLKLEYSNLRSLIFDMTDTPDISIENMKSLGVFSGIALKMLFLGAHLKASDKEAIFGKGIQRRINFLKAALARINLNFEPVVNMNIKPKFEYFLPKNDEELINLLNTATGAKPTMSQVTAVKLNPLVTDSEAELKLVKEEGTDTEFNTPA